MHQAKTTLSKLVDQALAGEEVVIAKAGRPLVKLTPVAETASKAKRGIVGSMEGEIWFGPGWDQPDEDMLNAGDRDIFPSAEEIASG